MDSERQGYAVAAPSLGAHDSGASLGAAHSAAALDVARHPRRHSKVPPSRAGCPPGPAAPDRRHRVRRTRRPHDIARHCTRARVLPCPRLQIPSQDSRGVPCQDLQAPDLRRLPPSSPPHQRPSTSPSRTSSLSSPPMRHVSVRSGQQNFAALGRPAPSHERVIDVRRHIGRAAGRLVAEARAWVRSTV